MTLGCRFKNTLFAGALTVAFAAPFITSSAFAARVAIMDSGFSLKHELLSPQILINKRDPLNGVDDDGNGFQDDTFGWNFAKNSPKVFSPEIDKLFDDNVRAFLQIASLVETGRATPEQLAALKQAAENPEFMAGVNAYGSYAHGTHVAGIVAYQNPNVELINIKHLPDPMERPNLFLFPTGRKLFFNPYEFLEKLIFGNGQPKLSKQQFMEMLQFEAINNGRSLLRQTRYFQNRKADIVNCSWGASIEMIIPGILKAHQELLGGNPTKPELIKMLKFVANHLLNYSKKFTETATASLFVMAAGNESRNNDQIPAIPSNINSINSISVAATAGRIALAPFSNYGVNTVDIAAPGVAIISAVPGNKYLPMSGTSQAAPYVSKTASMMKDLNRKLTPKKLKMILMGTVDVKEFLRGKVRTSGIVNPKRALHAAKLSLEMSYKEAIQRARVEIADL